MTSRRLAANLTAFFLVTVALIVYGMVDLLGNPLVSPTSVSAVFPNAAGIYENFPVELDGVDVGSVTGEVLTHHGARVEMAINHGVDVPGDVVASITLANDLGEQVVELTPAHGGRAPALRSGAVVPTAPGGVPAEVGDVVASATRLLQAIPADKLDELLTELATGLAGRAGDLQTIMTAGTEFSDEFLAYQQQFDELLQNAPPVLTAVAAEGPQLRQALVNTASLLEVLAQHSGALVDLLHQGATAAGQLGTLVTKESPDLACIVSDTARITTNLAQAQNLSNLSTSLATNQLFFGAITKVAVAGTAPALQSSAANDPDQVFLRTRLLLPPRSPSPASYATPTVLPPILPGAGCSTEFGQGAGPAAQPGFAPAAGGVLDPPSAADAEVRGAGDPPGTAGTQAAALAADERPGGPGGTPGPLLAVLGLLIPALALAWGARPSARARRRRR